MVDIKQVADELCLSAVIILSLMKPSAGYRLQTKDVAIDAEGNIGFSRWMKDIDGMGRYSLRDRYLLRGR